MRFVAVVNDRAGDQHVFGPFSSRPIADDFAARWMPNNAEGYEPEAYGVFPLLTPSKNIPRQK